MISVRPIRPEDVEPMVNNALADNHGALSVTHVVWKENEIVGYISLGSVPTALVWMDTKKTVVQDSIQMLTCLEALAADKGAKWLYVPCPSKSPLHPYLERLGFVDSQIDKLYLRKI